MDWVGKADVLEYYPDVVVESARLTLDVPAVLRVRRYVHKNRRGGVALSRQNVILRDDSTCQCAAAGALWLAGCGRW